MGEFLKNLLGAGLGGSMIIAVVLLLRLVLRKTPKKYICLLWLVAAVRLMLPVQIESALSLQPEFVQEIPARVEQSMQASGSEENTRQSPVVPEPSRPDYATRPTETPQETVPSQPAQAVSDAQAAVSVDLWQIVGWIWGIGVAGMLLYSAVAYLRLRRRVRDGVVYANRVWITGQDTAMVLGFFRPQIYLSAGLDDGQRMLVLRHERCHIRRGDHLWKPLGYLVLAVHWYNPLVWVGYRLLCRDLEMACDEAVVRDLDLAQRKAYSAALLSCSTHHGGIAACPVAFGEVSAKERIVNVLNYKKPKFWIILVTVVVVTVVSVCFLTSPKPQEESGPQPDDWGIYVTAEEPISVCVTLCFHQSGAAEGDVYQYSDVFTVQRRNGSEWEDLQILADPAFTGQLRTLENDGVTLMTVQWNQIYGVLPEGTYRVCTEVVNQNGESRAYYGEFVIGALSEAEIYDRFLQTIRELRGDGTDYRIQVDYEILSEYPYISGTTVEVWQSGSDFYFKQTYCFTQEHSAEKIMVEKDGVQYLSARSETLEDWNVDWYRVEESDYWNPPNVIISTEWESLQPSKITSEKTADGILYTIVIPTGEHGDRTAPVYEDYYTLCLNENFELMSMQRYRCDVSYYSGFGRTGYFETEYWVTYRILPADPEGLQQLLDALLAEVKAAGAA